MSNMSELWNKRYTENPFQNGREPSPFLKQMLPRLQKGKTLDVAMGEGVNSVYLARSGFHVKGIDFSNVAIEHAQSWAKENGVEIQTEILDLDLFIFGLLEYDSIIMTYYRPPLSRYYSEIVRSLKQGGTLLVESWTQEEQNELLTGPQETFNCYFHCNELFPLLKGLQILFYNEGFENGRHVLQCLARKPLDKDMLKYGELLQVTSPVSNNKNQEKSSALKLAESLFKK